MTAYNTEVSLVEALVSCGLLNGHGTLEARRLIMQGAVSVNGVVDRDLRRRLGPGKYNISIRNRTATVEVEET